MGLPTTKTDICNLALDFIGEPPIADPTVAQKVPQLCDRHYDLARVAVLSLSKWHIALVLDDLAEISSPEPPAPWTHSFQLPTDWLLTFNSSLGGYTGPRVAPFKTMGQSIHTNVSSVRLLYARDIVNVSEMPPLLVKAIAYELATEIVIPIKGDDSRLQTLNAKREMVLDEARSAGAIVDPNEVWGVDYLTTARAGSNSPFFGGPDA